MRIFYIAGPGNVAGTYQHWKAGGDDPSQVARTYSGQFFDVCQELGAQARLISTHPDAAEFDDGDFSFRRWTLKYKSGPGPLYHLEQWQLGQRAAEEAKAFGADLVIASGGVGHLFALGAVKRAGMAIVPSLHCVLWRHGQQPHGLIAKLNGRFLARDPLAILTVSQDVSDQVREVAGGRPRPIIEFVPTFQREQFEGITPPPTGRKPFRVLYAGRVEENKGVFDLLQIAKRFKREGREEFEFDLCGSGGALAKLETDAQAAGLADTFRCHGHCSRDVMKQMYSRSHVVVVPTTTRFIEGFNKVVAEAVLAGRPVVTSSVCPALSYVREAVAEVPPDDVEAYGNAILKLCDSPEHYNTLATAAAELGEQFYDDSVSWASAIRQVLTQVPERKAAPASA